MKILHVVSDLAKNTGGPPVTVSSIAKQLAMRGHTISIATIAKNGNQIDLSEITGAGVTINTFDPWGPRYFGISLGMAKYLYRETANHDIIMIHSLYLFHTFAASWLARWFGVPYIIQPHGSLDPFLYRRHRYRKMIAEKISQNRILKGASAIWYSTEEERDLAAPYVNAKVPSIVVPPLVDYSNCVASRSRDLQSHLRAIRKDPIILFVGRINFVKGIDILLESYSELRRRIPQLRLILAGPIDADMSRRLRILERKFNLVGAIEYPGFVGEQDKYKLLQKASVFVLPSASESFANAVVEAIAAGVPVVITDTVKIHRIVSFSDCGLVIRRDVRELTSALLQILSEDDLWMRMHKNTLSCLKMHFDAAKWTDLAIDYLKAIVSKAHRPESR